MTLCYLQGAPQAGSGKSPAHRVNHVVHQLVDLGPLEPGFSTVLHDFGVGSCDIKGINYQLDSGETSSSFSSTVIYVREKLYLKHE